MLRALALALLLAAPAAAGTLEGRAVTLNVLTYDDPAHPDLESIGRTVIVGPGLEFGMGPEFRSGAFDVVPVEVEIGPERIVFSYAAGSGEFWSAAFNGYVLRFATDCALFDRVEIDSGGTTMPLTAQDIRTDRGALYVNVSGRHFGPGVRLALNLSVADCPMS